MWQDRQEGDIIMNTLNFRKNTLNMIVLYDIAKELQKNKINQEFLQDQTQVWIFDDEFNYGFTYELEMEEIFEANAREYLPYEEDVEMMLELNTCNSECIDCKYEECIYPF